MSNQPSRVRGDRIDWLDVARGGAILLVVFYHSIIYFDALADGSRLYRSLNYFLHPIRMPTFFAISGFLASEAIKGDWLQLSSRRIALLAYLFVLWTVIHWLFFAYIPGTARPEDMGATAWQIVRALYRPETALWFLWAMIFYLIVAKGTPGRIRAPVLAISTSISVASYASIIGVDHFAYNSALRYAPFFLAACWYGAPFFRSIGRRPLALLFSAIPAYLALYVTYKVDLAVVSGGLRFLLSMIGLALGCSLAVCATSIGFVRAPLRYIGRNTLQVFVAHGPMTALLTTLLVAGAGDLPMTRYWAPPLISLASVALTLGLKRLCDELGFGWLYRVPFVKRPTRRPSSAEDRIGSTT